MKSPRNPFRARAQAVLDQEAADWLARRDRGLSPHAQDAYLQWLRESEAHSAAIARAEATFRRVLQLSAWQHEHSAEPNPDLLARPRPRVRWLWPAAAAAAAILVGAAWWRISIPPQAAVVATTKNYLRVNERRVLPDGSSVELKDGSRLDVRYSASERRVRLIGGEAQFSVMKDAARPFVAEAVGVAVRAVGTVFDVRLGADAVEVFVTEGQVRVGRAGQRPGQIFDPAADNEENVPMVMARQGASVALNDPMRRPTVTDLSSEELGRLLAWQAPRLVFEETPLADAIAEFNRRNRHQLVLGDAALGSKLIGGMFRPDNVEGFVWFLTDVIGVRAETHGDRTVLWPRR